MSSFSTASLSSQIFNFASLLCGGRLGGTQSIYFSSSSPRLYPLVGTCGPMPTGSFSGWNTWHIVSQNDRIGSASVLIPASRDISSASVEEWETAVCFLLIHVIGTKVFGPTNIRYAPVVDLESLIEPAKSASAHRTSWQSAGLFPTKACNIQSFVVWM